MNPDRYWSGVSGYPGLSLGEHDQGFEELASVFDGGG